MIHAQLKRLIKELHMTQHEFAQRISIDEGYLSRILQGKVVPAERIILLIENMFDVNREWLETGEGEMFSKPDTSLIKKQVIQYIDMLDEDQLHAVAAFVRYLTEKK